MRAGPAPENALTLLVDTYNVLHVTGVLPPDLAGLDVEGLARLLAESRWRRERIVLVCDGLPGRGRSSSPMALAGAEVVFAGLRSDADTVIESMLARDSAPRRLTVISSDRRVQAAAKRRRAGALPSEAFLRMLAEDVAVRRDPAPPSPREQVPLGDHAIAHWLQVFGFDAKAVLARAGRASIERAGVVRRKETTSAPSKPVRAPESAPPQVLTPPEAAPDPLVDDALREWADRFDPSELDMRKWVRGVDPLDRPGDQR